MRRLLSEQLAAGVRPQDVLYWLREDLEGTRGVLLAAVSQEVLQLLDLEDPEAQFGKVVEVIRWLSPEIIPHIAARKPMRSDEPFE